MRVNSNTPMARLANQRLNMLRNGDMGTNAVNSTIQRIAIKHHPGLLTNASILQTAETGTRNLEAASAAIAEFVEARLSGSSARNLDKEAAAAISGNITMPYVGEPNGTHVWCEETETYVFVGSGGTHGINLLALLLGDYDEDEAEPRYDHPDPITSMTPNTSVIQQKTLAP